MKRLLLIPLLLTIASCVAEDITLIVGMSQDEFIKTMKTLKASDLSSDTGILATTRERIQGATWYIRDYDVIIQTDFKDDKLSAIAYWKYAEFKESREESVKNVMLLRFDVAEKRVSAILLPGANKPECIQPDYAKWLQIKVGMTEKEVKQILGTPLSEDRVPPEFIFDPQYVKLLTYGRIRFNSPSLPGAFEFHVATKLGKVSETIDPFGGVFSTDGKPTTPSPVAPKDHTVFEYYPRFVDLRWTPSSGEYPIEYVIEVEAGQLEQSADKEKSEYHYYFEERQNSNCPYQAISFVGKNPGRWRVKATNKKGESDWSEWSYFRFER